ncbi:uncharacterized protein [Spinacia oleracea]|uniref:Uncharacterized protein n=1 Tax=Spinacia oleracea TaxID=3562 RepID=A0ABM3QJM3_SPIOL|nr:uncharacterized protein LOC130459937 [Spinacia oleracea]XP_056683558.1 uncharacterized protein LOC130459937 [Spinacia oleracea]
MNIEIRSDYDLLGRSMNIETSQHGADPNLGLQGEKPLIVALSSGNIQIIKCLLKAGADPNTTNFYDYTPIEIAVVEGNLAVVDTLFDVSARIPHIPTWSIHGIHEYLNSEEEKTQEEIVDETDEYIDVHKRIRVAAYYSCYLSCTCSINPEVD